MDDTFNIQCDIAKVEQTLGLVFGYGIVCKIDGQPYLDTQGDHIPEQSMLEASYDFMVQSRELRDSHGKSDRGTVVFALPLTDEICKGLDITAKKTGLVVAVKPDAELLAKFVSGEYTGFSIGGKRVEDEIIDVGEDLPDA